MYTYIYIYYIYMYMYIYIYVHVYVHLYVHVYIHIYLNSEFSWPMESIHMIIPWLPGTTRLCTPRVTLSASCGTKRTRRKFQPRPAEARYAGTVTSAPLEMTKTIYIYVYIHYIYITWSQNRCIHILSILI